MYKLTVCAYQSNAKELSMQGKGDGTKCAIINQLWARLS